MLFAAPCQCPFYYLYSIHDHSTTQQLIDSDAVSHQYENVVEVNKKCEGDGNEYDYENMHVEEIT